MTTHDQASADNDTRVAVRQLGGQIARPANPIDPFADFEVLVPYRGGPVIREDDGRVDAIATISAGKKDARGFPVISRDGTIEIHDQANRAPGLKEVLAANGGKRLTIAVVSNNPREFLQNRLALYTASRVAVYGDKDKLVVNHERKALDDAGRQKHDKNGKPVTVIEREEVVRAVSPERYAEVAGWCKSQFSLYFALAKWGEDGKPIMYFPDGFGLYRLRFTSINTFDSFRNQMKLVAKQTHGLLAGIPFDLSLDNRDLTGPDSKRHNVPIWTLVPKPPRTIELTAAAFVEMAQAGIAQAKLLHLPAPAAETIEAAEFDGPDTDYVDDVIVGEVIASPSEAEVQQIAQGGGCDVERHRARWFGGMLDGSALDTDEGRAEFFRAYTSTLRPALRTSSLGEFLEAASEREAWAMLDAAQSAAVADKKARGVWGQAVQQRAAAAPARSYEDVFDQDDDMPEPPVRTLEAENREREAPIVDATAEVIESVAVAESDEGSADEAPPDGTAPRQSLPSAPDLTANLAVETLRTSYREWLTALGKLGYGDGDAPIAENRVDLASKTELARALARLIQLVEGLQPPDDDADDGELESAF